MSDIHEFAVPGWLPAIVGNWLESTMHFVAGSWTVDLPLEELFDTVRLGATRAEMRASGLFQAATDEPAKRQAALALHLIRSVGSLAFVSESHVRMGSQLDIEVVNEATPLDVYCATALASLTFAAGYATENRGREGFTYQSMGRAA